MYKKKSFTLIELLVVIVIIGILAGVIMISTSSSIDKANFAKAKVFEESVQNNLAANMVSAWDADHVTKGTTWILNDKWGSNNGTFYDSTSTACTTSLCPQIVTDNQMGNVLSFDGANDYINCGINPSIADITNNFTMELWAYPKSIIEIATESTSGISGSTGQKYAIGAIQGTSVWGDGHAGAGIFVGTNGISVYEHAANYMPALLVYSGSVIKWSHIIIVYSNKQPKLYLNGLLVKTGLTSLKTYVHQGLYGSDSGIGKGSYGLFNGLIKSTKIYNAALSSSQIKQNYIAGLNSLLSQGSISKDAYNERINELAYEK